MRNSKFIITWLLILSTLATASEPAPRSASNGTCSLRANNTFHSIAFTTQVQDYTITGEGRTNQSYTDLSLTVESNGCLVMRFTGNISAKGVFTTKWNFGPVLGGGTLTLVTINGTTEGNLDNHRLSPFNDTAPGFHFTNAIGILPHNVPKSLASVSQVLSDAVKSTLSGCKSPDPEKTREELVRALLKRQNIFGAPGQIENTGSQSQCADCIGEAFAACAACGFACAFTPFGLGCGCIAGEPLLFTQCHNPGNGLGQGCCPVGCGDYQTFLGITISYQCCQSGQSCLDPNRGLCCVGGTQPCDSKECCPPNAPCRDIGICCPTNQNTCITRSGPACCAPGDECRDDICCPPDQVICDSVCCDPGETCLLGTCCSANNMCNTACCGADERCADDTNSICCSVLDVFSNGLCCPSGSLNSGGICCPSGTDNIDGICCGSSQINCGGVCCGGICTGNSCTYETVEQCMAIGGTSLCTIVSNCATPQNGFTFSGICENGCCIPEQIIP